MDRKLNKAELAGLSSAAGRRDAAARELQEAEAALADLLVSVGLEPGVNYQIRPDGTVVEPTPTPISSPETS